MESILKYDIKILQETYIVITVLSSSSSHILINNVLLWVEELIPLMFMCLFGHVQHHNQARTIFGLWMSVVTSTFLLLLRLLFFFFFSSSSSSSSWHYNSLWVLAYSAILFHSSPSIAILLQFWIFIFPRTCLTSSSHLDLCPPILLAAIGLHSVIRFTVLCLATFAIWPIHLILCTSLRLTLLPPTSE